MNNSNSPKSGTAKRIGKALAALLAFIFAVLYVTTASYLSAILFLCISAIAIATMDEKLRNKHSFLQRSGTLALICFVAAIVAVRVGKLSNSVDRPEATNPTTVNYIDILSTYIISNPEEPSIKNMHDLADWESLFHNGSASGINILSVHDTMCRVLPIADDTTVVEYRPDYTYKYRLATENYLHPISTHGRLIDYKVRFYILCDTVVKVTPVTTCLNQQGDTGVYAQEPGFLLFGFEKRQQVARERQKLYEHREQMRSQEIARARIAEAEGLKEHFAASCLHRSGAFIDLIVYVKQQLHDPASFEHVQTTCQVVNDHVVVLMQYRAKNALGAKVLSYVKAKVTFDCKVKSVEYM